MIRRCTAFKLPIEFCLSVQPVLLYTVFHTAAGRTLRIVRKTFNLDHIYLARLSPSNRRSHFPGSSTYPIFPIEEATPSTASVALSIIWARRQLHCGKERPALGYRTCRILLFDSWVAAAQLFFHSPEQEATLLLRPDSTISSAHYTLD
ncbi:hypothetical protein BJX65DRAFT_106235 [Aspergillus insuetus]